MTPAEIRKLHPAYRKLAREALADVRRPEVPELPPVETMSVEDLRAEVEAGREAFGVVVNELADLRARVRIIERDRDFWRDVQVRTTSGERGHKRTGQSNREERESR